MAVGSFSAGLSGLNASATYLNVIGNNLANMNTVGFKASTVAFQDLVSQTISGSSLNPIQFGLGVMTGAISPTFSQGAIENSADATNVAIQGNGFFVVKVPGGQAYTRAGNFSFDSSGALVTPGGQKVQGWNVVDPATGTISTAGLPSDLTVPPGVLRPPSATNQFSMTTNLDARAAAGSTLNTSVNMYDATGQVHLMSVTYTKTGAGAWDYRVEVPGADVSGGTAGTPFQMAAGTVTFDGLGKLASATVAAPGTGGGTTPAIADIAFTSPVWSNGAVATPLKWKLIDANGIASITGYSAASATSSISQNGSGAAMIDSVNIAADGTILAMNAAGQTIPLGQLALANFSNPKGLVKLGSNQYGESQASGVPNIGVAGTGGRGTLIGSALEQSNVDIAKEFTQMILAQRGYQANSKSIQVSDEMLVETLNMKR